jgi:hypothetical protein
MSNQAARPPLTQEQKDIVANDFARRNEGLTIAECDQVRRRKYARYCLDRKDPAYVAIKMWLLHGRHKKVA